MNYQNKSKKGNKLSRYHLEAGIASVHCLAANFNHTNWDSILFYYDELLKISPSMVIKLNRCIALLFAKGPETALETLKNLKNEKNMKEDYISLLIFALVYEKMGDKEKSLNYYLDALPKARLQTEKDYLKNQISKINN